MTLKQLIAEQFSETQKRRLRKLRYLLKGGSKFASSLRSGCKLRDKILIGTHHKTGSAWLHSIFEAICHYHSLTYYYGDQENLPACFDVFLQDHSKFNFDSLEQPFRGVHLIRDPRDLIISGCFYHQKSNEKWLHQPRKEFGSLTYQQKINSFSNIDDQIIFEMENSGRENIFDMMNWDYTRPEFYELKYEDLIEDTDLILFHKVFLFLGFGGFAIPSLLAISYNKSLFSGKTRKSVHVRSGKTNQWKRYLKPIHKKRFLELFGNVLVKLDYEPPDSNWSGF